MKRFCRILAAVLFIVIICCQATAFALTGKEKEERFNAALRQLETYLETFDSDNRNISAIVRAFRELENYSNSLQLWNYSLILQMIEEGDFGILMDTKLAILKKSAPFADYVKSLKSAIQPVSDLEQYARGREAEKNGSPDEANRHYLNANGFFDSHLRIEQISMSLCSSQYDRAIQLYGRQKYKEAYDLFVKTSGYLDSDDMAASIASMLGFTPEVSPDHNAPADSADSAAKSTKTATAAPATTPQAQGFIIYAGQGVNIRNAPSAGSQSLGTTRLNEKLTAYEVVPGTDGSKDWYRVAYNGQDAYISVSLASKAQQKAAKPTATPHVHKLTHYDAKTPTKTAKGWYAYDKCNECGYSTYQERTLTAGSWSKWSTTAASETGTRDVQTKTETEDVMGTIYHYKRWWYYNTEAKEWWDSWAQYDFGNYKPGSGSWQYKDSKTPLSVIGSKNGYTRYKGGWWHQTTTTEVVGTKQVTYYRFRDYSESR